MTNLSPREWDEKSSTTPLKGADASRKPDISCLFPHSPDLDWKNLVTFCEVKNRGGAANERVSYIEAAGKASCLLYAQDSRHSVPCIRMLGPSIYLTIFDRGGLLSTAGFNIHQRPDIFLRILIGVSAGPLSALGFDTSIQWRTVCRDGKQRNIKQVVITRNGQPPCTIELTKVLFISDNIHGKGTTVWEGIILEPPGESTDRRGEQKESESGPGQVVAVKDSWIDPLRKYTEGMILSMLNERRIEGIPTFLHEQQVETFHPKSRPNNITMINNSTHILHSAVAHHPYYLRVLSRIVTAPVGVAITEFCCLGELLVAFLDYAASPYYYFDCNFMLIFRL